MSSITAASRAFSRSSQRPRCPAASSRHIMSCHKLCRGCWVSQLGSDPSSCIRASPECRSDKGGPACTPGSTERASYRSSPPSPLRSSRGPSHRATAPSCPSVLLALAAWPLSGSLYMMLITLTFYQWCFVPVTDADLTEPWWINMDGHYHVRRRPSHSGRARPGGLAGGPPTRAADPDYRVLRKVCINPALDGCRK